MGEFGALLATVPRRQPLRLRPLLPQLALRPVESPEGIHPEAGAQSTARRPASPEQHQTRSHWAIGSTTVRCSRQVCHGTDAKGTPLAPDLTNGKWLWGDGSLASITKIITDSVPNPKNYKSPTPPMGGARLSPSETSAVAAYVWALSHRRGG
jgi:mono/diheme cytochrome c family protein